MRTWAHWPLYCMLNIAAISNPIIHSTIILTLKNMALPRAFRNISLILFVIVIKCQTSTTRADDDDNEDTSEEYIEPRTRRSGSSSSALFSTVATMRAMLRPPRALDNTNGNTNLHHTGFEECYLWLRYAGKVIGLPGQTIFRIKATWFQLTCIGKLNYQTIVKHNILNILTLFETAIL